jgi:hypothetical protein
MAAASKGKSSTNAVASNPAGLATGVPTDSDVWSSDDPSALNTDPGPAEGVSAGLIDGAAGEAISASAGLHACSSQTADTPFGLASLTAGATAASAGFSLAAKNKGAKGTADSPTLDNAPTGAASGNGIAASPKTTDTPDRPACDAIVIPARFDTPVVAACTLVPRPRNGPPRSVRLVNLTERAEDSALLPGAKSAAGTAGSDSGRTTRDEAKDTEDPGDPTFIRAPFRMNLVVPL